MPVPVSSLSLAVQGIADFLDSQFGEEVTITVAHPQRAAEIAKGSAAHCLNVFAYRVAPSGFYAGAGADETQFIRIHTLITPFPADLDNAEGDADMRILGHAIRVLQSHPVLPITAAPLPGAAIVEPANRKDYRLQAVMLAPPMEEVNHIWTTQGGDLAYRLSAVYEFALIPIEPLDPRTDAARPRTLVLGTAVGIAGATAAFVEPDANTRAIALADDAAPASAAWLPVQMLVVDGALASRATLAAAATQVPWAVAGPPGGSVAVEVVWSTPGGEQAQAPQILPVATPVLDAPAARGALALAVPGGATGAVIRIRPAEGGAPVPASPFGNVLTLAVT
ncbi:MAG: Pvc16 family protein [Novosphingobium sp.]